MQLPVCQSATDAVFNFLKVDLDLATTFLLVGEGSSRDETRERTQTQARKIYTTVARFSNRLWFAPGDEAYLRTRLADLKHSLEQLGETF